MGIKSRLMLGIVVVAVGLVATDPARSSVPTPPAKGIAGTHG